MQISNNQNTYASQNTNKLGFGINGKSLVNALDNIAKFERNTSCVGNFIRPSEPLFVIGAETEIVRQSVRDFAHHLSEKGVKGTSTQVYEKAKSPFMKAMKALHKAAAKGPESLEKTKEKLVKYFEKRIGSYPLDLNRLKTSMGENAYHAHPDHFNPNHYTKHVNLSPSEIIPLK